MGHYELNYTDVLTATAVHTSDSHGMEMSGDYCRRERDDVENGPTSSVCYAEPLVVV